MWTHIETRIRANNSFHRTVRMLRIWGSALCSWQPVNLVVMLHARRQRALVTVLVIFVVGCSRVENYKQAQVRRADTEFTVELRGTRRLMAHDPVSALRGETYVEAFRLRLPRLEGIINGNEVPVNPGSYKYVGRIVIAGNSMKVDL